MRQKVEKGVKSNMSNQDLTIDRPRTRASIKQEAEDNKEYFKHALYSPVKTESVSLRRKKWGAENRHCSICNITFPKRMLYLDHELHSHKTKKIPIIDRKTRCCNICDKSFTRFVAYRHHMATRNNISIPSKRPNPNPLKKPDIDDPNNHCKSCNNTFKSQRNYYEHLIGVHRMSHLSSLKEPRKPKNMIPTIDMLNQFCDICNKKYEIKKKYVRHLVQGHDITLPDVYSEPSNFDKENLYCKLCDQKYLKRDNFLAHLKNIHRITPASRSDMIPDSNDKNNYCIACDTTFCSIKSYLYHLCSYHLDQIPELFRGIDCATPSATELRDKKYCVDCQKIFRLKQLYQIHMYKIHGADPLKSFSNVNGPDLNDPNNYCSLCDKTYRSRRSYRQHLFVVHNLTKPTLPERPFITSNTTPGLDDFKNHCNVCDKTYIALSSYRRHMSENHDIKILISAVLTSHVNRSKVPDIGGLPTNHCTACDKVYKNRVSYRRHMYAIHGITLPRKKKEIPQINSDESNYCSLCDKAYSSRKTYLQHTNKFHLAIKPEIKQDTEQKVV